MKRPLNIISFKTVSFLLLVSLFLVSCERKPKFPVQINEFIINNIRDEFGDETNNVAVKLKGIKQKVYVMENNDWKEYSGSIYFSPYIRFIRDIRFVRDNDDVVFFISRIEEHQIYNCIVKDQNDKKYEFSLGSIGENFFMRTDLKRELDFKLKSNSPDTYLKIICRTLNKNTKYRFDLDYSGIEKVEKFLNKHDYKIK